MDDSHYRDRLVVFGARYFASIYAGKDPGPVDPFFAGLIEEAIREKAGLTNGVPTNGVAKPLGAPAPDGLGEQAGAVFNVVKKHAGPDGVTPDQVAEWMKLPKQNVQYHLMTLAKRKFLGRVSTGHYCPTWDGATKAPVDVGSAPPGSVRDELQRRGMRNPGQLNVKVAEYAKAAGRDVTSVELGRHLKAKNTSTTAKGIAPLMKFGMMTKLRPGLYRWVAA